MECTGRTCSLKLALSLTMHDNEKKCKEFTPLQQQISAVTDAYNHNILYDCCAIL